MFMCHFECDTCIILSQMYQVCVAYLKNKMKCAGTGVTLGFAEGECFVQYRSRYVFNLFY